MRCYALPALSTYTKRMGIAQRDRSAMSRRIDPFALDMDLTGDQAAVVWITNSWAGRFTTWPCSSHTAPCRRFL